MYSLHDIEVKDFPIKEILKCEVEFAIGKHSTLILLAYVENEDYFLNEMPEFEDMEVLLHEGDKKSILFTGVVASVQVMESGQAKVIQIEGKSRSFLLAQARHSRSFQNTKISCRELVKEVVKGYEGYDENTLSYTGEDTEIKKLIVQYQETDWDFLQRVLSGTGLVITPDSAKEGLKLYAGIPDFEAEDIPYHVMGMEKDMGAYYSLKSNGRQVHTADFTQYRIASGHILRIFDSIFIQGQPMTVYSGRYLFESQELTGIYELQNPKGMVAAASYPMHLIGVALTGKVVNVSGTKVQVALDIDKGHEGRCGHWFPYSTISASKDGSGWYYMPEAGDDVRVYFPSKQEGEAIALSSVSSYSGPQDGGEDRMKDPNSRYLRTKAGQQLVLSPEHIRLSCAGNTSAVTINNDGKVMIEAQIKLKAAAEELLALHAEEELNIHASKQVLLQSLDGGYIASDSGDVLLRGTEVNYD